MAPVYRVLARLCRIINHQQSLSYSTGRTQRNHRDYTQQCVVDATKEVAPWFEILSVGWLSLKRMPKLCAM
jgi:hypothetical protein